MRHLVLGTAGHIDHGKTALVRALTGTDTDRLPDEKRRGITIDLGFARLPLDDDLELGIVDVPGHEAFIRNMLAGATGIDLVLLVIAADEGVMPQTREHLAIIELLGIRRGVIALTRTDLVDVEWLQLVGDEVQELLTGTALAGAPVVPVSARSGDGLAALRAELDRVARTVPHRPHDDLFRMPIDRVFTVRGTGTVVTGTVWSGTLQQDQQVRIEPAGLTARVRGLQQHGEDCSRVAAGARAAVALTAIDRHALTRGDTLVDGDGWAPASILTVDLRVLADADAPIRARQRVRVHVGTAEGLARIGLLSQELPPGGEAIVQLRLERPLLARAGDHVVLRSYSPIHTIAGGLVLEPRAPKRKRLAPETAASLQHLQRPDTALSAAVALAGPAGVAAVELPVLTGLAPARVELLLAGSDDLVRIADRVLTAAPLHHCGAAVLRFLEQFHARSPLADGPEREATRKAVGADFEFVFEPALADLAASGMVSFVGSCVTLPGHRPTPDAVQQQVIATLASLYAEAGLQPPDLPELPAEIAGRDDLPLLLRHLERTGRLVRLGGSRWCDAAAVAAAVETLRAALLPDTPYPLSRYKAELPLTRKHSIPLLEFLDRNAITHRIGDDRALMGQGEA